MRDLDPGAVLVDIFPGGEVDVPDDEDTVISRGSEIFIALVLKPLYLAASELL